MSQEIRVEGKLYRVPDWQIEPVPPFEHVTFPWYHLECEDCGKELWLPPEAPVEVANEITILHELEHMDAAVRRILG